MMIHIDEIDASEEAERYTAEMLDLRRGNTPGPIRAAYIRPTLAAAIGASTNEVLFSRQTLEKQNARKRDHDLYIDLPNALQRGMCRLQPGPPARLMFFHQRQHDGDRFLRAVVKATENGTELYLLSFHIVRPADLARYIKITKEIKRRSSVGFQN